MQGTIRSMIIALVLLVIVTVGYQMITGNSPDALGPTPTPPPTNVPSGKSVSYAPSITVENQRLSGNNTVVVAKVVAANNGWVSVHVDAGGTPRTGYVGYLIVKRGNNNGIKVTLKDISGLTGTMWVMLHADGGLKGRFEFPGPDAPVVSSNGQAILASFTLSR